MGRYRVIFFKELTKGKLVIVVVYKSKSPFGDSIYSPVQFSILKHPNKQVVAELKSDKSFH